MRQERQGEIQSALALVGAVVGAGFASGREVMRFFTMFGSFSWVGCVLAAIVLAGLSAWAAILSNRLGAQDLGTLCRRALGGVGGQAAAWLNGALIAVTAGAMLAAMGELVALALPVHNAYTIGIAVSLVLSTLMARRGLSAIATIGGWLLPTCLLLYALLMRLPAPEASAATAAMPTGAWRALPLAFAYAAMNAALGGGVLCELGRERTTASILRTCAIAGVMLLLLLLSANAALYRHVGELRDAALPVVMLSRSLGALGYWLCLVTLVLAVMTTLVALQRTLARMLEVHLPQQITWPLVVALPLLTGLTGFDALVGSVYPLMGALSTLLFLAIVLKPLKVRSQKHNKCVVRSSSQLPERSVHHDPPNKRPSPTP